MGFAVLNAASRATQGSKIPTKSHSSPPSTAGSANCPLISQGMLFGSLEMLQYSTKPVGNA